ncbi:MAG: GNAT family N-acetyltransferase [Thermomicrobiales bacterium]|nr:GNAT family N-acetyltransferase [Thermomicrobiales bacterium]
MTLEFPAPAGPISVREIDTLRPDELADLCEVLTACVDEGASLGFHAPLAHQAARAYWLQLPRPGVTLLVAEAEGQIGGTVQLHAAGSANGAHRGEVAKLLVHPAWRRRGVATSLMRALEALARQRGKRLLVLDIREGDPSNVVYAALGYLQGGRIPDWARDARGELTATVFWYKQLASVEPSSGHADDLQPASPYPPAPEE